MESFIEFGLLVGLFFAYGLAALAILIAVFAVYEWLFWERPERRKR